VLLVVVLLLLGWLGSYFLVEHFFSKPTEAIPEIRLGDGLNGPKGMVWIPGGEFLMGSDHKKHKPMRSLRIK
jgi:formylglycine-generating enzyme